MKLLLRLKDFRFQCYESGTQEQIDPSCEMTASKLQFFNSGRKLCRWKCTAVNASPTSRRPKRPTRENIASIAATSVCMLTFHGIQSHEKIVSLLVWTHLKTLFLISSWLMIVSVWLMFNEQRQFGGLIYGAEIVIIYNLLYWKVASLHSLPTLCTFCWTIQVKLMNKYKYCKMHDINVVLFN